MSTEYEILAATGRYSVAVERGTFSRVLSEPGDRVVIADDYFLDRLGAGDPAIGLTASETSKSLHALPDIIEKMRALGASRKTTIVAVGGGAVQDIAGFVASVYMRGIPWIYVPTTLLGMVDSCIGGKSSINVGSYKNIIGTFYPPQRIYIDPDLCATLTAEMRVAGTCEAAKICFARSRDTFAAYMALKISVDFGVDCLTKTIDLSLQSKKWFIETDEFDRAERLLLNFGHTFGHAIESASAFNLSHGVAVGLGMLVAIEFASARGMNAGPATTQLRRHIEDILGHLEGLGTLASSLSRDGLWRAFCSDKKHDPDSFCLVLPSEGAAPLSRVFLPRDANSRAAVLSAFDRACSSLSKNVAW